MLKIKSKPVIAMAMLFSIASISFAAGSVPVYDADNYPPQFEGSDASSQESGEGSQSSDSHSPNLEKKVGRLEQQINNLQGSDAVNRINALQAEVQSLRGQVEELTHQLQQLQNQQKSLYSDIDKRLKNQQASKQPSDNNTTEAKQTVPIKSRVNTSDQEESKDTSSSDDNQPNIAEEQQIYQTAYNFIKAKKYDEAVNALQGMLQKYPSGQFAANAHYWLGELYGLMNKNDQAIAEFNTVAKNYPDSPKVSDAHLKIGLLYATQFKWSEAKTAFKKVISKYPSSTSARVAAEQLKQIKLAGH